MQAKFLFMIIVILALGAGALVMMKTQGGAKEIAHEPAVTTPVANDASPAESHAKPRIPAYQLASEVGTLPPTLPASKFVGKTREAYEAAKKIPQTLAQLPCYCECDQGFGHKSLHSCFADDHAASCAVCVDEALLAYKLQKEQRMTPEQVRDVIIEKYSAEHAGHRH